jgi:uncharacterized SAM-binding protein YcdF (DUF218 family)
MSYYIEKLLPIFIYPLGLTLLLCIAALALSFAGRDLTLRMSISFAVIILWLASTPVFARLLWGMLEQQNSSAPIEKISSKDVIVVLGGGLAWQAGMGSTTSDPAMQTSRLLYGASDRLVQAALLWRAGKGQTIIISSGALPWAASSVSPTEISLAAEILEAYGVPSDSIIRDTNSRNTRENATNTAAIWREKHFRSGLLVTSAIHMPRALASFRKAGLDVTPWPADLGGQYPPMNIFDLLPDAHYLAVTTLAIKEWVGLAVYRLRGWA